MELLAFHVSIYIHAYVMETFANFMLSDVFLLLLPPLPNFLIVWSTQEVDTHSFWEAQRRLTAV